MTTTPSHAETLYGISTRGSALWQELNAVGEALREQYPDDFFDARRRAVRNALNGLSVALDLVGAAADQLNPSTPVGANAARLFAQTTAERRQFEF